MKYKEMQYICSKQNGKCKNCPLNCIDDWTENNTTWCFKKLRERYMNKYKMYMDRGHEQEAQLCMQEYISMEQKYLKKEGNK